MVWPLKTNLIQFGCADHWKVSYKCKIIPRNVNGKNLISIINGINLNFYWRIYLYIFNWIFRLNLFINWKFDNELWIKCVTKEKISDYFLSKKAHLISMNLFLFLNINWNYWNPYEVKQQFGTKQFDSWFMIIIMQCYEKWKQKWKI